MSVLTGADRAQETAQSVGLSATITLLGAAGLGLQTFASAGLDGKLVPYVIEHTTSGQWEVGEGIYTASGAVLNRTIVYSNSAGTTAPINFALGLVEVWVDMPAEKAVMLDADSAHLTLPAGLTIAGQLDGVTVLDIATLNVSTSIQPTADNAVSLGTAAKRWSDIRAMTATLSGLLSGAAATFSGLVTAAAGAVINAAQTLALAGALISGAPTWGSAQAITLSTAAQPAITSVGTLTSLTMGGAIGAQAITPNTDNLYALGTASFRWSDVRGVTGTFTTLTAALTGNASTATALQNARTINGVSFDGTGNITVTAAAGTLTGTTLNATVVNSSLQTLGTISTGVWAAQAVNPGTDNLSTLGTASKRWSDLQAVTGTFGGAVTLSSTLAIGGITYTFPASQGASRFLQTDGSGNLSWVAEGATISLAGLSDVTITSATNGQALIFNSGSGKWTNTFTSLLTGLGTVTTGAWAAGAVNPAVDNTSTLGTASKRWSDLQSMTGTFGGVATFAATAAFTAASPVSFTNAQTLTVAQTAQTVGAATLTLPNFASVSDTFAFVTLAQTLANKTLSSPTFSGTVAGTPTWASNQAITLSTAAQPNVTSLGTLAANLLFVDATYDIGASGATRPRNIFASGTGTFGGTLQTFGQLLANEGTNRNFGVVTDATQLGSSGVAIGSWVDGFGSYAPLSIVASVVRIGTNVNIDLALSATSATFTNTAGSDDIVTIGNSTNAQGTGIRFLTGSTHYGWLFAGQYNIGAALEWTPSTVVGGTTFSTPVMTLSQTGALGVAGLVTATGGILVPTNQIKITGGFGYVNPTGNGQGILGTDAASGLLLAGQGSSYDVEIDNMNGVGVAVVPTGTTTWAMQGAATINGNFTFTTDATYDIGASGATRPRNYFGSGTGTFGGALVAASGAFAGDLTVTAAGSLSALFNGGQIGFTVTSAAVTYGIYTLATGQCDMVFAHLATGNTGYFQWMNGTNGATTLMTLNPVGYLGLADGLSVQGAATFYSTIAAASLPTSPGAAGTLWVDTAGGLNIVKRA